MSTTARMTAPKAPSKVPSTSPKVQVNDVVDSQFRVFVDAGHGGLSPYRLYLPTKYVTYPNKAFKHPVAFSDTLKPTPFHGKGWFFEGVWNRVLTSKVWAILKELQIPAVNICGDNNWSSSYVDHSLKHRVTVANTIGKNVKWPIYISTHANASKLHLARGYEVYSSPGDTKSDQLAEWHYECVAKLFGDKIKMRPDLSDGDHDREARFYVLTQTKMPAILIEHLFFDNYQDALLLMREDVQDCFAYAQVYTILKYIEKCYNVNLIFPEPPQLNL